MLVGIIATILSKYINAFLSKISKKHRERRRLAEEAQVEEIQIIAADTTLVILRLLMLAINWLKTILFFFAFVWSSYMLSTMEILLLYIIISFSILVFIFLISFLKIWRFTFFQDHLILKAYSPKYASLIKKLSDKKEY